MRKIIVQTGFISSLLSNLVVNKILFQVFHFDIIVHLFESLWFFFVAKKDRQDTVYLSWLESESI